MVCTLYGKAFDALTPETQEQYKRGMSYNSFVEWTKKDLITRIREQVEAIGKDGEDR